MSAKKKSAERAERQKFDAWAKVRSQQSPGDWVLTGGHDGEDFWAWEAWKGRAAQEATQQAQLQARIEELELEVAQLRGR